jgi:hypothetical protein
MGFLDKTKEAMDSSSILDKGKGLSDKAKDKMSAFDSDTLIADAIMKAVEKQEKVNCILQEREVNYRIDGIELSAGIPPTITFTVGRVGESLGLEDKQ